jgi:hypothetical protein
MIKNRLSGFGVFAGLLLFTACVQKPDQARTAAWYSRFCQNHDIAALLANEDVSGLMGYFDTSGSVIYMHTDTVYRDNRDSCKYHVHGRSLHRGMITPYSGVLQLGNATLFDRAFYWAMDSAMTILDKDRETAFGSRFVSCSGRYRFMEDSSKPYSGVFEGILEFGLHLNPNGTLEDDLADWMGDGFSNFIWQGFWRRYGSTTKTPCVWGQGQLPWKWKITEPEPIADRWWNETNKN